MKNASNTIEDLLEILAGLKDQAKIEIDSSDVTITHSIARQVFKGVALTDRQHVLMKEKLLAYREQFTALDYDFDRALDCLRMPLREIDRSRWIKITDSLGTNTVYESSSAPFIAVRFVFNKKLIGRLDSLNLKIKEKHYDKQEKIRYYELTEYNLFHIVETLKDSNFEISDEAERLYNEIKEMNDNKKNYVPGIYGFKLENLSDKAVDYMISSIGEPSVETLSLYNDRRFVYGLEHFDEQDLYQSMADLLPLTKKLIQRESTSVFVHKDRYSLSNIIESLIELQRFPLLILLQSNTAADDIVQLHSLFKNIIPDEEQTVLFRLENSNIEGAQFNEYVKKNNLNNLVDNNTKIVYINTNKLPKPLLKSDWVPHTSLHMGSFNALSTNKISPYLAQSDLQIYYDAEMSPYFKHGFNKNKVHII